MQIFINESKKEIAVIYNDKQKIFSYDGEGKMKDNLVKLTLYMQIITAHRHKDLNVGSLWKLWSELKTNILNETYEGLTDTQKMYAEIYAQTFKMTAEGLDDCDAETIEDVNKILNSNFEQ